MSQQIFGASYTKNLILVLLLGKNACERGLRQGAEKRLGTVQAKRTEPDDLVLGFTGAIIPVCVYVVVLLKPPF